MIRPTDILREYGQAIRGYWGDLDGRCVRDELDILAGLIEEKNNGELSPDEAKNIREDLDICPFGNGHWEDFCKDYHCYEDL